MRLRLRLRMRARVGARVRVRETIGGEDEGDVRVGDTERIRVE